MYLEKEEPTEFWIRTSGERIAEETDATFTENNSEIVLETPNDGEFTLYIDPDKEDSYITLNHPSENTPTTASLSELSKLTFDIRPHEGQYRVITSGELNIDFGL